VIETAEYTADDLAAGEWLFARQWSFVLGAPRLDILPPADRPEIAFAGRSNVGKSTLINELVRRRGLARTSNTPGRTQELNYFAAPDLNFYLVDMPGYGFAKAPKAMVEAWTGLVRAYLRGRPTLKRVFMLIDARHGLKPPDLPIMALLDEAAVSYQLVLTKADKISEIALERTIERLENDAATHPACYPRICATSSTDGRGIDLLRAEIATMLARSG
jgi:GTP-binding protein